VIGGYTPGTHGIDALIIDFYRGKDLIYAARVRTGFVPATPRETFTKIKHLKIDLFICQFARGNSGARWRQGLTAAKMKDRIWLTS
jgi:bifunctional non-homologous end joining protein LigD